MSSYPPTEMLPTIKLLKLSRPYPTPGTYILEKSSPIPKPLKVTDTSCSKCDTLLPIVESELQCNIPATDSAIIQDEDPSNIIAIVIRDLAYNYYNLIKPWAIDLINDSIN